MADAEFEIMENAEAVAGPTVKGALVPGVRPDWLAERVYKPA